MASHSTARGAPSVGEDDPLSPSSLQTLARERKAGLSCSECRRSKLKCDRVFPCQSCIRRGCDNICPNGVLAATKGNKVLMARAEKLSAQVKAMTARITDLERALSEAGAHEGKKKNPLLAQAPIKWEEPSDDEVPPDSDGEVTSASSPPPDGIDDGAYISPAVQHLKAFAQGSARPDNERISPFQSQDLGLPPELGMLVNAFPLGPSEPQGVTKAAFLHYIPSRQRSAQLFDIFYHNTVLYQPVSYAHFETVLSSIHGVGDGPPSVDRIAPHALALFFIILSFGTFFEGRAYAHASAELFHALSRAAIALQSIVHTHTLDTVQALFLLNLYKLVSGRPSTEWRWLIGGICARVAQGMALQRDCATWISDPEEVQRRRVLFWEIFVFETWTGVLSSRPPALSIRQTTCRFPEDREPVEYNGELEIGYHAWKYRYTATCLSLVVQHVFNARNPTYGALLELDAKIRRFPLPNHLRTPIDDPPTPWAADVDVAMKQQATTIMLEGTLLYLHRAYLPLIPTGGASKPQQFSRSVWACYRSASRTIRALKSLYATYPERTGKVWSFWTSMYTSSISLGSLVLERPHCQLAAHALKELEGGFPVYEEGTARCAGPATRDILRGLLDRVRTAWTAAQQEPRQVCSDDCCARLTPAEVADFACGRDRWFAPPPSSGSGSQTSSVAGSMPSPLIDTASDSVPGLVPPTLPALDTFQAASVDQLYPLADINYEYATPAPLSAASLRGSLVPPTPEHVRFPPHHPAQREEPHIALQPISYPYGLEENPSTRMPHYQYTLPQQQQQQQQQHHPHQLHQSHQPQPLHQHHQQHQVHQPSNSPTARHHGYAFSQHEQQQYSPKGGSPAELASWNNYVSILGCPPLAITKAGLISCPDALAYTLKRY